MRWRPPAGTVGGVLSSRVHPTSTPTRPGERKACCASNTNFGIGISRRPLPRRYRDGCHDFYGGRLGRCARIVGLNPMIWGWAVSRLSFGLEMTY